MNLQNVKNIVIPEGGVKTIHDSNNRLLWGASGYNVKYNGDSAQQTYSGKNQLGYDYVSVKALNTGSSRTWYDNLKTMVYNGVTYKLNDDGTVFVTGTATGASYIVLANPVSGLTPGTEYTLNGCPAGGSTATYSLRIYANGSYKTENGSGYTFTYSNEDIIRINVSNGTVLPEDGKLFKPMVRLSSITDDSYEPYVGGQPSPSVTYPQPVDVVTGLQTIAISDGEFSSSYVVNLGSIRLCKINTSYDYIHKNNDSWYVHEEIGKIDSYNGETVSTAYLSTTGQLSTGAMVYYILNVATDTQITDSSLIAQLDSVYQFVSRYGYNATVSGNLPIIIDRTNL